MLVRWGELPRQTKSFLVRLIQACEENGDPAPEVPRRHLITSVSLCMEVDPRVRKRSVNRIEPTPWPPALSNWIARNYPALSVESFCVSLSSDQRFEDPAENPAGETLSAPK